MGFDLDRHPTTKTSRPQNGTEIFGTLAGLARILGASKEEQAEIKAAEVKPAPRNAESQAHNLEIK